jgi:hypothetical protein
VLKRLSAELAAMVDLLAADAVIDPERTSPLLQRLMQSPVLRELCAACLRDNPRGARAALITAFSSILREVPQRVLLHTQNILIPLNKTIASFVTDHSSRNDHGGRDRSTSGGGRASPAGGDGASGGGGCSPEEHHARVELLHQLCARFEGDPAVINLFFDGDGYERFAAGPRHPGHSAGGGGGGGGARGADKPGGFFPVFSALTECVASTAPLIVYAIVHAG